MEQTVVQRFAVAVVTAQVRQAVAVVTAQAGLRLLSMAGTGSIRGTWEDLAFKTLRLTRRNSEQLTIRSPKNCRIG